MRIIVRVKAGTKIEAIKKTGDKEFSARVKAPPVEGRANEAVVALLSDHFDVPKSRISIVRGHKSRIKLIDIS